MKLAGETTKTIAQILNQNDIVLLKGLVGSGKSYLIEEVWSEASFCRFERDSVLRNDLFTFFFSLGIYTSKRKDVGQSIAMQAFQDVSRLKSPTMVVEKIVNYTYNKILRKYNRVFNEAELIIIDFLFKKAKAQSPLYLVLDNIENASNADAEFIIKIIRTNILENLFKHKLKIILIFNQGEQTPESNRLLNAIPENYQVQHTIDDNSYAKYVRHLVKTPLSEIYIQTMGAITYKDLGLTRIAIDIIENCQLDLIHDSSPTSIDSMLSIFDEVLKIHFTKHDKELYNLKIASIMGLVVQIYDLGVLTENDYEALRDSLELCARLDLLKQFDKNSDTVIEFFHPVICDLLYYKLEQKSEYHKKYAEYLQKAKPLQHLIISKHFLLGKKNEEASWHYLSSLAVQAFRGIESLDTIEELEGYLNERSTTKEYYTIVYASLELYKTGAFQQSKEKLEEMEPIYFVSDFLLGLFNYIKARNMILICDETSEFQNIVQLLRKSCDIFLKNNIYDLYFDSLSALINVYSYKLSDLNTARILEEEYIQEYHQLDRFENGELHDFYLDFRRRTASLVSPESAHRRLQKIEADICESKIMQTYKILGDRVGYSIYAGEFEDTIIALEKLFDYIESKDFFPFPELYKCKSNEIVCKVFQTRESLHAVNLNIKRGISILKKLISQGYTSHVLELNLAALYLLNTEYENAYMHFKKLEQKLDQYNSIFYYTYVHSNLAAYHVLNCNFAEARNHAELVQAQLSRWDDNFRPFYVEQNKCMIRLIESESCLSPLELFNAFYKESKIGKTWNFLGNGILFSELLFYTL